MLLLLFRPSTGAAPVGRGLAFGSLLGPSATSDTVPVGDIAIGSATTPEGKGDSI